jgi:hypothetical protein
LTTDTIPFVLGENNEIKIKGAIGNSGPLNTEHHAQVIDSIPGHLDSKKQVVEVNIDKSVLVIHDSSFNPGNGYASIPLRFRGTTPYIEVTLARKNETIKGWFGLDLTYMGSFVAGKTFSEDKHLFDIFNKFGIRKTAVTGRKQ